MRGILAVGLVAALIAIAAGADAQGEDAALVVLAEMEAAIEPAAERQLDRALDTARERGAEALVVRLDTPGGLGSTMRDMVESILGAEVPVIVFIAPPGARAASAGTLIAAAGHIAAMAPGTNIGAASPISGSGEDLPPTLRRKIDEDTTALVRSIASLRGRNAEAIEATVLEARAYTAEEALDLDVIDLIAPDLPALLARIDGMSVETSTGMRTLRTAGAEVDQVGRGIVDRFVDFIANPTLAYVLILVGAYGVIYEIADPGNFGPGVLGALGLVLGFLGAGLLPASAAGIALLIAGIILLLLETQLEGFGWAGLGAAICWVFAGLLLFGNVFADPPAFDDPLRVSAWAIGVLAAASLGFVAAVWTLGRGGGRSEAFIPEAERLLLGRSGTALEALAPSGRVEVAGEARTAMIEGLDDLAPGAAVTVVGVYAGDILKVAPAGSPAARAVDPPGPGGWRARLAAAGIARLWSGIRARGEGN